MKLKKIVLKFTLLLLLVSNLISNVAAINYNIGVQRDQELVWKCKLCNENEMDNIFGNNWDASGIFQNLSKGTKMKWKITDTEYNEIYLKINFSIWIWTSRKIWGDKDNDSQMIYFSNPKNYPQGWNFSNDTSFVPFWFPIPIGDYLASLSLNEWYDVDNRVLPTLNVEIKENAVLPGVPLKDIKIITIYNDQGILSSYKLYINENVVIIDIAFEFIPIYVIPTLIGLICVLTLSIIIYITKKRKFVKRK
ncbi:MAG: hypothetical protein ACFE9Q_00640 [Candidatus Hodarchaeota archaeon]